jgi:hypothetical protein
MSCRAGLSASTWRRGAPKDSAIEGGGADVMASRLVLAAPQRYPEPSTTGAGQRSALWNDTLVLAQSLADWRILLSGNQRLANVEGIIAAGCCGAKN